MREQVYQISSCGLSEVTSHFSWHIITEKGVGKSAGFDVTQTWVQVLFMALQELCDLGQITEPL